MDRQSKARVVEGEVVLPSAFLLTSKKTVTATINALEASGYVCFSQLVRGDVFSIEAFRR